MKLTTKKKLVIVKVLTILAIILMLLTNAVFATESGTTGIGTAEVTQATDNIKRVITSIAMPLGRSFNICKYCNCRNKNDSKCE